MLLPVDVTVPSRGHPAATPPIGPRNRNYEPVQIIRGPAAEFAKRQVAEARRGPRQTEAVVVDLPSSFQSAGRLKKLIDAQVYPRSEHTLVFITGHSSMTEKDQSFASGGQCDDDCDPGCYGESVHVNTIIKWVNARKTKCTLILNGCRHPGFGRPAKQPKKMATPFVNILFPCKINQRVVEIVPTNPIRQAVLRAFENGLRAGRTPTEILEDLNDRPGNSDMKEFKFEADIFGGSEFVVDK